MRLGTTTPRPIASRLGISRERASQRVEALRLARERREEVFLAIALQHLALIAALDGDTRCAARLLGYVNARFDQLEVQREPTEQWVYEMLLATLRESLDERSDYESDGRRRRVGRRTGS